MISIVLLLTDLKLRLIHSFKVRSVRHPTFEPEGVPDRTLTYLPHEPVLLMRITELRGDFAQSTGQAAL
jgi:hypothetical protein